MLIVFNSLFSFLFLLQVNKDAQVLFLKKSCFLFGFFFFLRMEREKLEREKLERERIKLEREYLERERIRDEQWRAEMLR